MNAAGCRDLLPHTERVEETFNHARIGSAIRAEPVSQLSTQEEQLCGRLPWESLEVSYEWSKTFGPPVALMLHQGLEMIRFANAFA